MSFSRAGRIGLLCIDHPPVNAIAAHLVEALDAALGDFERADLDALVLLCAGRTWVAGADLAAFDDPGFSARPFNAWLARLEAGTRPVVAALHGTVLGGGLELAMACHHRVCLRGTRLGLPEVNIGLIPGSLGTQRLPRLVRGELALDMVTSGRLLDADEAAREGLVDGVVDADLRGAATAAAARLAADPASLRRTRQLRVQPACEDAFARAEAEAQRKPGWPQLAAAVRCLRAAQTLPFEAGEAVEAQAFAGLVHAPSARALRHLFFAQREAARMPGPPAAQARTVQRAGIVGAGTMGGGIAMALLNAGIATVLVDTTEAQLQRGLATIRAHYEASVAKGRLTAQQLAQRLALLQGAVDDAALADCDLVIEAVYENLELKQQVCARLGAVARPGAILASNTSTLDIDVLAAASGRPQDFCGMHFFSPAHVMRLLELVRGAGTGADTLATVLQLARRIGKVAVVSGVCYGFIGNRMAEVYMREAEFLLMEGASPADIDAAVEALGLAMGPCRMLDMAGIDVGAKTVIERGKAGGLPDDPSYRVVVRRLFELGRFGQKSGAGYYRYAGRTPVADPELDTIVQALAQAHGIARRTAIDRQEIVERLLYPLINEGYKILEEGIACRPGDIDVVWTAGYGFPDHQGGPMFMAREIGLAGIADRLRHYARARGDRFGYWTPAATLVRHSLSEEGIA
ncbi:MAG TPA: 3-hydroxyacyl-CoA dehydrogenase NAD-binding domain-containing protein [Pseudorhodoferax sp.]|nr:3-hydroxyacyl-CoA dehydrogenase NAD-binding domain-containing protein [Pseudorhodoferax sp.]